MKFVVALFATTTAVLAGGAVDPCFDFDNRGDLSCYTFDREHPPCSDVNPCTRENSACKTFTSPNGPVKACGCAEGFNFGANSKVVTVGTAGQAERFNYFCAPQTVGCADPDYVAMHKDECCRIASVAEANADTCRPGSSASGSGADPSRPPITRPDAGPVSTNGGCWDWKDGDVLLAVETCPGRDCVRFTTNTGAQFAKCGCLPPRISSQDGKTCVEPTCPEGSTLTDAGDKCVCNEGLVLVDSFGPFNPVCRAPPGGALTCSSLIDGKPFSEVCRCRGQQCKESSSGGNAECVGVSDAVCPPNSKLIYVDCQPRCECAPGFTGPDCRAFSCDKCDTKLLGGICVAATDADGNVVTGSGECRCRDGFVPRPNTDLDSLYEFVCTEDNLCTENRINFCRQANANCEDGYCRCPSGFVPVRKEVVDNTSPDFVCKPYQDSGCSCSGNEQCIKDDSGNTRCVCPAVFANYRDCKFPRCDDTCPFRNEAGDQNRYCVGQKNDTTDGSVIQSEPYCACAPGYSGPDCTKDDGDACATVKCASPYVCSSGRCVCPLRHTTADGECENATDPVDHKCREFILVPRNDEITAEAVDTIVTLFLGLPDEAMICWEDERPSREDREKKIRVIICQICSYAGECTSNCTAADVDTDDAKTTAEEDEALHALLGEPYEAPASSSSGDDTEDDSSAAASILASVALVAAAMVAAF